MTEEELKATCKKLFEITRHIYGITFIDQDKSQRIKLADFNKIHDIAAEAYNMEAEAFKKGLWND
jgi:hypothetical protein